MNNERELQTTGTKTRPWKTVYTFLKTKILSGEYPSWSPLPSIETLIKDQGIGRSAIQRAVTALANDGLIERRAGSGCFVLPPKEICLRENQEVPCRKLQTALVACKESGMTRREIDFIVDSYFSTRNE